MYTHTYTQICLYFITDELNVYIYRPRLRQSDIGMFQTCLSLLSAILAENIHVSGELHIERIYLFCLMWSYGSFLEDKDRKAFNELLKTLSTALVSCLQK